MSGFLQDLRYSLRIQTKTPVFTIVAILTLGLGIAAVVTVFSFSDAIFLRKIPVPNTTKLVRIALSPYGTWETSYRQYAIFRDQNRSFQSLAAHYSTAPLYVRANGIANDVQSAIVTWNYFPMLGIQPALGRFFAPAEDSAPMRNPVVVISHDFWQARYQGDRNVLGQTMTINGTAFQIIGVAPKGFAGVEMGVAPNQLWIPTMMLPVGYRFCDALNGNEMIGASQPGTQHWECRVLSMIGILKPGVTRQQAAAEMQGLRHFAIRPGYNDTEERMIVEPVRGVREMDRRFFVDLAGRLGATGSLLLLIACANVAGLLIARGAVRTREMATRLAVGASRSRIVRQLLTESLMLALAGGGLGVLIAQWANRGLMNFYSVNDEGYPLYFDLHSDHGVLVGAVVVTLFCTVLAGLLPAWHNAHSDVTGSLKSDSGGVRGRSRTQAVLVAAQIALSFGLLVPTGLLLRSLQHVEFRAGFDVKQVAGLRLRPRLVGYAPERAQAFVREACRRLEALPGVESVTLTAASGSVWGRGNDALVSLPREALKSGQQYRMFYQEVGPHYFATLSIPFLRGRDFLETDTSQSPLVVIVNETLAQQLWNTTAVIDRILSVDNKDFRVVGVVKDAQISNPVEGPIPEAYFAYWQNVFRPQVDARLAVRVAGNVQAALGSLTDAMAEVDSQVPITETMPLFDQVRGRYVDLRVAASVLTAAGVLALLFAVLGLYCAAAFAVSQSTGEIGVRMALGALPRQVVRVFMSRSLRMVIGGLSAGFVLSAIGSRFLAAWLFGVSASDPTVYVVVGFVLATASGLAAYLPALTAARIEPMAALRHE